MAISLPPDTLLKGVVKGSQQGAGASYNIFHWWIYRSAGNSNSDAVLAELKLHLETLWAHVRDRTPGESTWTVADIYYSLPGANEWLVLGTLTLGLSGNDSSDPLPAGTSAVVTGPTPKPGRRARKFLPPFGETYSDAQQWTAGALTSLAAWALEWLTGINTVDPSEWIYPIALNAVTWAWDALTSARANAVPGYQRRRKPFVGI